jgi:hypothetical protein
MGQAKAIKKYTPKEVREWLAREEHYGPWEVKEPKEEIEYKKRRGLPVSNLARIDFHGGPKTGPLAHPDDTSAHKNGVTVFGLEKGHNTIAIDVYGEKDALDVYVDPSERDISRLRSAARRDGRKLNTVRFLLDNKTGDLVVWDAWNSTHEHVIERLYGINENELTLRGSVLADSISFETGDTSFYSLLDKLLITFNYDGEDPIGVKRFNEVDMTTDSGVLLDKVLSKVAFNRALKRVSFSVIGRKTELLENEHTLSIEEHIANMLSTMVGTIKEQKLGTDEGSIAAIQKLEFTSKDLGKARRAVDKSIKSGWELGLKHANDEISNAKKKVFSANMRRIDEDAAEFLKANGFRMLGNLTADMKKVVLNILMNGAKFSWSIEDIVQKIYDSLLKKGFIALTTNAVETDRTNEEG